MPPAAEGEEQPAEAVPAPEGQPQGESQLEEREAAAEASQGHSGQAAVEEPAPGKAARRKGNRKAPAKAATKPAAEQPQKEGRATPPEVDSTTRRIVADAGMNGIEISELASQVRGKHRGFKVRDYGYAQFKAYVAHLDDIEVERIGKEWFARMAD